jgi:hypothetical protein
MNYRTFIVCLLLALPVQLDKLSKSGSLEFFEILIAFLVACGIALFWAYIATWLRNKFAKDLSDSYITKVQLGFSAIGIALLISVFFKQNDVDTSTAITKAPSLIEEASLRADAQLRLVKACNSKPNSDAEKCGKIGDIFTSCLKELNKPRSQLVDSIEFCSSQIQNSN